MALKTSRPFNEVYLNEGTTSIATTPVAAQCVSPVAGTIERVIASTTGTTTGTITVAVAVNGGSDIASSTLTIAAGAGFIASTFEPGMLGTTPTHVSEGDTITLTPSGGTGSSIGGAFVVVIRQTGGGI